VERHVPGHIARLLARHGERKGACAAALRFARQIQFSRPKTWASVNFIVAHDGFTLRDLVSYNDKHNEANGEDNRDGHSDNRSWNCGAEGPTNDPVIRALRLRQMRNLLATLMLSQGTPMVCAGDEFGRTQNGNNNAYCHDDEISWVHWNLDEDQQALVKFFRRLTALFHLYPVLRRSRFFTGEINPAINVKDVTWIDANGSEMKAETWDNERTRSFGMLLDGRAQVSGIKQQGHDVTLLIVFNAHHDVVKFKLPRSAESSGWSRLIDTNDPQLPAQHFKLRAVYEVTGRSLLLFERVPLTKRLRSRDVIG